MQTGRWVRVAAFCLPMLLPTTVSAQVKVITFEPTLEAHSPEQAGVLILKPLPAGTTIRFHLRNGMPNSVYTIWIAYYDPDTGQLPAGFPAQGNRVAPLGKLAARYADGMGLDPGLTFMTDDHGNGSKQITLDYDLTDRASVGNADLNVQTVQPIGAPAKSIRVTTTWLRKFIGEYALADRPYTCSNYDATYDPDSAAYDPIASRGRDARYWQCVNPTTGQPRVHWWPWVHFRLANHVDYLTHGFIGGNHEDHIIEMIGRRAPR